MYDKRNSIQVDNRIGKLGWQSIRGNLRQLGVLPISMMRSGQIKSTSIYMDRSLGDDTNQQVPFEIKPTTKGQEFNQKVKLQKVFGNGLISLFQRKKILKQRTKELEQELIKQKVKTQNLVNASNVLNPEQRIMKALRHFRDAQYFRVPRNDIELKPNKFIYISYFIQSHQYFQNLLYLFSILYLLITFFEPNQRYQLDYYQSTTTNVEILILILFFFDWFLYTTHSYFDIDRLNKEKYLSNKIFVVKTLLIFLYFVDFFHYVTHIYIDHLRFSRYLRPMSLFVYNQELRRNIQSIFMSWKQIIQLILFFFLMTFFWALIGYKFIGNLDGQQEYDPYFQSFDNLATSFSLLYALGSNDNYPEAMVPSYEFSEYYFIYFLIYVSLYTLLFVPIPVSMVFNAYRDNRCKLVILDRLKQREALLACFIALDYQEQKKISKETFFRFMKEVFLHKKNEVKCIPRIFAMVDINGNETLSLNEFFEIIDFLERDQYLSVPIFPDFKIWLQFRKFMNKNLKIKVIVKSIQFEFIMFVFVMFNCGVVLTEMILENSNDPYDQNIVKYFTNMDDNFLYIYITECVMRIIGLGVTNYFEDEWNIFDFTLVIITISSSFFQSLLTFMKSARGFKSTKILKVSKVNKMFRALKALRTVKVMNFLLLGADTLVQLKMMIQRIFMCAPLVFQMIPIIIGVFYFWAVIGMEIFNTVTQPYKEGSIYVKEDVAYCDFNTFSGALLLLLQIALEAAWIQIMADQQYKFSSLFTPIFYFISFHMVLQLVLLSLIKGIVWEIFSIVEQTSKENEIEEEKIQKQKTRVDQYNLEKNKHVQSVRRARIRMSKFNNLTLSKEDDYQKFLSNLSEKESLSQIEEEVEKNSEYHDGQCKISQIIQTYDSKVNQQRKKNIQTIEDESDEKSKGENLFKRVYSSQSSITPNQIEEQYDLESDQNININIQAQVLVKNEENNEQNKVHKSCILQRSFSRDNMRDEPQNNDPKNFLYSAKQSPQNNRQSILSIRGSGFSYNSSKNKSKQVMKLNTLKIQHNYIEQQQNSIFFDNESVEMFLKEKIKSVKEIKKLIQQYPCKYDPDLQIFDSDDEEIKQLALLIIINVQIQLLKRTNQNQKLIQNIFKENRQRMVYSKTILINLVSKQQGNEDKINQKYILKRALMKETNSDKIKKLEIDYFSKSYGFFFDVFNEIDYSPLIKFQSQLLHYLDMALRHNSSDFLTAVRLIQIIEKNVSSVLLTKGSIFKFLFKDTQDKWFFLQREEANDIISPVGAGKGPWNFQNFLPLEQTEVCLDYFKSSESTDINTMLIENFIAFKKMSFSVDSHKEFEEFQLEQTIMDLFLSQHSVQDQKIFETQTIKQLNAINISKPLIQVNKVMIVLLNYVSTTQSEKNDRRFSIQQPKNIPDEDAAQSRLKDGKMKISIDLLKQTANHDRDKISQFTSLKLPFIIELMEGFKSVLKLRQDKLLIKMSQFLNSQIYKYKKIPIINQTQGRHDSDDNGQRNSPAKLKQSLRTYI